MKCGVTNHSVVNTSVEACAEVHDTDMKVRICGGTEGGIVCFEMRMSVNWFIIFCFG